MVQLNELGKWELQQIFDGARGGNGHQALADLSQAEQASQVEFHQAAGAAERDVIPLGGFDRRAELFDAPAADRGRCIEKFGPSVESAQWDHVTLRCASGLVELNLRSLFSLAEVRQSLVTVAAARTVEDLL